MAYDPAHHRRRSIRLPHYDYAAPGRYFVTVCAQHRDCLFGEVEEDTVRLSEAGRIVQARWDDLPAYYPRVRLDAFVIMPNHVHGIIGLTDLDGTDPNGGVGAPLVGALPKAETSRDRAGTRPAPTPDDETSRRNAPCGLGVVVGSFKSTRNGSSAPITNLASPATTSSRTRCGGISTDSTRTGEGRDGDHAYRTHRAKSRNVAFFPYIRMPTR